MDLEKIRQDCLPVLADLLQEEPFDWELVEKAAAQTGYPSGLVRLAFQDCLSRVLEELGAFWMKQVMESVSQKDLEGLRTHEKVRKILETSFIVLEKDKAALRQIVDKKFLRQYGITELQLFYQAINRLWYHVGDQSTDYNFYTKRLLLAWVYAPTFLFWLKETRSLEETMMILDRKLAQVAQIPKWKKNVSKIIDSFWKRGESGSYEDRV